MGVLQHQQGLRRRETPRTAPRSPLCLIVVLLCLLPTQPQPLFAHNATATEDQPPVTQKIRYHMPEAGEVFLVWGINGWATVPEEDRPAGTMMKDGVMHTPMVYEGDTFVAQIQVPVGTMVDYGFLITKKRNGAAVQIWEADGERDYHAIAARDDTIEAQTMLTLAQDQAPVIVVNRPLITQEIRYHMPEAGEVSLIWGVNGWLVVSEEMRPAGTVVKDSLMHTPMVREGGTFVAQVQVPAGATIDYGFMITKKRDGAAIEDVWDGDRDWRLIATQDDTVTVQATVTLAQATAIPSSIEIAMHVFIGICVILGVGIALRRTRRLPRHGPSVQLYDTVQDCLFLSLVILLSLALYTSDLGFYGDDWSFLGYLSMSEDQSLIGLFRALYGMPNTQMRPVQVLYLAGLYWIFGLQPLGYHCINAVVLLSSVVLFYLVLSELGQPRMLTLTVPMVYGLLPHYSTDRFWYVAFQANLSMALCFLSLYSDLRALRDPLSRLWNWKLLSVLSLLGSVLAYEVTIPLFLFNILLIWYLEKQRFGSAKKSLHRTSRTMSRAGNPLALVAAMTFKVLTVSTTHTSDAGVGEGAVFIIKRAFAINYGDYDYGLNFKQAIAVNYGYYGISLPRIVWRILHDYPDATILAMGAGLGLVILCYLCRAAKQSEAELRSRTSMLRLIAWGLVVFELGYAIFLTNSSVMFTPTGRGNRTAIAAAVGVALSLVGGLGWVSMILPSDTLRKGVFCTLVTLLCMSGFLINNTLATFWAKAYREQNEILAEIYREFPSLPAGSTLILDGVCPYIGPAVVFDSFWDLAGALLIHYRDYTLQADVVTSNLKVREDGLYTSLPGVPRIEYRYPYDEKLFIYHFERRISYRLTDPGAARFYFQTFNPGYSSHCPQETAEHGASVF